MSGEQVCGGLQACRGEGPDGRVQEGRVGGHHVQRETRLSASFLAWLPSRVSLALRALLSWARSHSLTRARVLPEPRAHRWRVLPRRTQSSRACAASNRVCLAVVFKNFFLFIFFLLCLLDLTCFPGGSLRVEAGRRREKSFAGGQTWGPQGDGGGYCGYWLPTPNPPSPSPRHTLPSLLCGVQTTFCSPLFSSPYFFLYLALSPPYRTRHTHESKTKATHNPEEMVEDALNEPEASSAPLQPSPPPPPAAALPAVE